MLDNSIMKYVSQGNRTKDISTSDEYLLTSEVSSKIIDILKNEK